jgi:ABC-type bacteriocin/lantibiotic exporter with double-glycine peptidase domain
MISLNIKKQIPNYCGPTALKMVLDFYGIKKSQKEIGRLSNVDEDGTEPWELLQAAKLYGISGEYIVGCSIEKLKSFISQGIPIIVDFQGNQGGHYSVVVGFEDGQIYLADPQSGKIVSFLEEEFRERWYEIYEIDGKDTLIYGEAVVLMGE